MRGLSAVGAAIALAGAAFAAIEPRGYLVPGAFDNLLVLTPAPVKGDPRYGADRAIFKRTCTLVGAPRYALASNEVE